MRKLNEIYNKLIEKARSQRDKITNNDIDDFITHWFWELIYNKWACFYLLILLLCVIWFIIWISFKYNFYDLQWCFFIASASFIGFLYSCFSAISGKYRWKIFIVSIILASLLFLFVNRYAFYAGVRYNLYHEAQIVKEISYEIFNMDIPDKEKKAKLDIIINHENKNANIEILKNGALWWRSPSERNKYDYYIEEQILIKNNIIQLDNGNEYTILYTYPTETKWYIGLTRSFTYSIFPDFLDKIFTDNKYQLTSSYFWDNYIYRRSFPLYAILILISVTFLIFAYIRQKQHELVMRDILTSKAIDNLEKEMNATVRNDLQSMSVDLTEEFVWDNKEAKEAIKVIIHDLKNISKLPEEFVNGDKQLAEVISEILYNLKNTCKLQGVFEEKSKNVQGKINNYINNIKEFIEYSAIKYKDLLQGKNEKMNISCIFDVVDKMFKKMKNKMERDAGAPNVEFEFLLPNMDKNVNINQARFENILNNLINNSSNQIARFTRTIRKNPELYRKYKGCIKIKLEEGIFRKGRQWVCLIVTDNGGGFDKKIIGIIYKMPVPSGASVKGKPRIGEGTQYIANYTKGMNGEIVAQNQKIGDFTWAVTKIYFPIIKE